jgi:glutamate-1-semialdehyde 2,1-aminomutase
MSDLGAEATTQQLVGRAERAIPGGANSCRRIVAPPMAFAGADGAYLEDCEGRRYLDYHAGYGAILLGHCNVAINDAIKAALKRCDLCAVGATPDEVTLAEKLVEHIPCADQALLCASGSEATYHAIRVARAATARCGVLKYQGSYHGFHDAVLPNKLTTVDTGREDPDLSLGTSAAVTGQTRVVGFNDLAATESQLRQRDIAALIVEPIAHNAPSLCPQPGFLEGLRTLCDRYGTVLIFDEVITGFRHALGGYQAIAGVTPDLTTLAKAMGGGLHIGALVGRRELMEHFNTRLDGDVFYSGTCNGNSVAVAAALATIAVLESEPVHEHIFALGERMRDGLRELVARHDLEACVCGFGSVYVLVFAAPPMVSSSDALRNDRARFLAFKAELLARGVFEMPAVNALRSHISYAHTAEHIDQALTAADAALAATLARERSPDAAPEAGTGERVVR